ncbi:MAG TPA: leucyl-tRNA--protein transferase [Rectinemataceae bacterium]|nr:leucyl-tRNA--protein transferase [Rectinemataceae bacterium]
MSSAEPAIPLVSGDVDPADLVSAFERGFPLEFCASESFDPDFVAALVREGFIPMATALDEGCELLLPKLHLVRSCLDPRLVHVTATARRASRGLVLTARRAFDEVLSACLATHGDGWLRPPLVELFRKLGARNIEHGFGLLSFELWRGERLVAGEFGALVGSCYTSWSGFRSEDGAGTAQLVATARALDRAGVRLWDLGMPLDYKAGLGAISLSRLEFLSRFREARSFSGTVDLAFLPEDARLLLDASFGAAEDFDP